MSASLGVLLLSLCAMVGGGQDHGVTTITVHTADVQGGRLPGVPITVRSLSNDRQVREMKCVTSQDGICSIQISKNFRFSVSAELAGFLPVTVGPASLPQRQTTISFL